VGGHEEDSRGCTGKGKGLRSMKGKAGAEETASPIREWQSHGRSKKQLLQHSGKEKGEAANHGVERQKLKKKKRRGGRKDFCNAHAPRPERAGRRVEHNKR